MWDAVAGHETVDLQLESTTLPIQSWEDTAGIIANLRLVITSCTAVAHLAGAMGVPTWVVVPILPYYTWALPGEKSPWYGSVTLFRQEKFGCWEAPFAKIKERLKGGKV
jgi:ADP-heptose:LPS heptosyltransferase